MDFKSQGFEESTSGVALGNGASLPIARAASLLHSINSVVSQDDLCVCAKVSTTLKKLLETLDIVQLLTQGACFCSRPICGSLMIFS